MSDQSQKQLPIQKFRTFADDLEKQKRGGKSETNEEKLASEKKESEEVMVPTAETRKPIPIPKLNIIKAPINPPERLKDKPETSLRKSTIPAYHELQKKINKIDSESKNNSPKPVNPIKVPKPMINKANKKKPLKKLAIGYDATVITDTKKHNPDFFPTVIKSFSDWLKKILTPKPKATPKYMVADSSTRKGVIQKATTKSGSIFTAYNQSLKDQIRKRRLEEASRDNQTKEDPETSWSPYTETGYDLLESPDLEKEVSLGMPEVVITSDSIKADFADEPAAEADQAEVDFDEERWSSPEPKKPAVTESVPVQDDQSLSSNSENKESGEKESERANMLQTEETVNQDVKNKSKDDEQKVTFSNKFEGADTNTVSVMVLMIIIGLVSVILVGRLVYQYINISPENITAPTSRVVAALENSTLNNLYLTTADLNNISNLIDQKRQTSGEAILEIALTDTEGNELSAPYIFELLDFSVIPTMKQSITSIRFLSVDQKEEMILLQFNNEENVRGGFLNWEDNLSSDLNGLYNSPVTNNNFSDKQTAGIDTRELTTSNGSVITYSLVDGNTALISVNKTDLERIINLEFKP